MKRFSNYLSTPFFLGSITFLILFTYNDLYVSIGLGYTVFIFMLFLSRLGKTIPILELILLMSAMQWIVGAHFSYASEFKHFKYAMYVSESMYMQLVVPSLVAFSFGIFLLYPKVSMEGINRNLHSFVLQRPRLPFMLIFIGFLSEFLSGTVPGLAGFAIYLTKSLKYVGLGLLIFREDSNRWVFFSVIMGLALANAIIGGSFHDFLLWATMMFSIIAVKYDIRFINKFLFVSLGLFMAYLLQNSKQEFRESIQGKGSIERIEIFVDIVQLQMDDLSSLFQSGKLEMTNVRLNQGWIISAVISHVPKYEPHAGGETIYDAIEAAIFPRFLLPDKKKAGGRENYRRFTGLNITENTSMGISVVGEAYANYGFTGAYFFMFCWGSFLSLMMRGFSKYGQRNHLVFVFLPLVFLQVIKAETELVVVLNHLIKSTIYMLVVLWLIGTNYAPVNSFPRNRI